MKNRININSYRGSQEITLTQGTSHMVIPGRVLYLVIEQLSKAQEFLYGSPPNRSDYVEWETR